MTEVMEVEGKRRGRPPNAVINAVAAEPEERMVEVRTLRKYTPHLCYEKNADDLWVPVRDQDGALIDQSKVKIGETADRFGRPVDKYRDILDSIPAGVVVQLPKAEAARAIKLGIATTTERSFE